MVTERPSYVARGLKLVASLVLGVFVIVALLLVLLGVFARPGSDGISRVAGRPILTVLSGSMRGVFNPGDMIVDNPITPTNAQRLAAGNIITFHVANTDSNNLITHRIVGVEHKNGQIAYQTKGDANNAPDLESVTPAQIVGTYRNRVPYGGYLLQWAQQKITFLVIVMVPVLYLVVMEIAKRWNEPDKRKDSGSNPAGDDAVSVEAEETEEPQQILVDAVARHRRGDHSDEPNNRLSVVPSLDGPDREGGSTSAPR